MSIRKDKKGNWRLHSNNAPRQGTKRNAGSRPSVGCTCFLCIGNKKQEIEEKINLKDFKEQINNNYLDN